MLPLIEREVANNKKWVSQEEILDVFAVSQLMPGAIAINSATFIGYKIAGRIGAVVATAGVVLPAFIIITLISIFYSKFEDNPRVEAVFSGIRPVIVALITLAVLRMQKSSIVDNTGRTLAILALLLMIFKDVQAVLIILFGAAVGLGTYRFFPKKTAKILNSRGREQ